MTIAQRQERKHFLKTFFFGKALLDPSLPNEGEREKGTQKVPLKAEAFPVCHNRFVSVCVMREGGE